MLDRCQGITRSPSAFIVQPTYFRGVMRDVCLFFFAVGMFCAPLHTLLSLFHFLSPWNRFSNSECSCKCLALFSCF